jgi:hypothetical protein
MKDHKLIEAALENIEAVTDTLTDNELLKNIPVVGTALKLIGAASDIRDRLFAAKLLTFLRAIESFDESARQRIRDRITDDPNEARRVGETLIMVIDKVTSVHKAHIIAILFVAYSHGRLSERLFRECTQIVESVFIDDLVAFLDPKRDLRQGVRVPDMNYHGEYDILFSLKHTPLVDLSAAEEIRQLGRNFYRVSSIGHALRESYLDFAAKSRRQQGGGHVR